MKSARIVKPNEPLEVQEVETPKPKGSQVLIKVESTGVCHSDILYGKEVTGVMKDNFLKPLIEG